MGVLFSRATPSSPAPTPVPSPAPTPAAPTTKKTGDKAEKTSFGFVAGFDTTVENIAQLKLLEPDALKSITTHFAASVVPRPRDLPGLTDTVVFSWYRAGTSREDAQKQYRDIMRIADQLEDRDAFTVRVVAGSGKEKVLTLAAAQKQLKM